MTERPSIDLGSAKQLPLHPDVDGTEDTAEWHLADTGPFQQTRRGRWPRLSAPVLAAVFTGGVGGGLARYGIAEAWPTPASAFPWATFTVNTVGSFALALLLVILAELSAPRRYARALLGTGFLGAFTTFSSVAAATDQLAAHGHPRTAAVYLSGSLLAALAASLLGLLLGRTIAASRRRGEDVGSRRRR